MNLGKGKEAILFTYILLASVSAIGQTGNGYSYRFEGSSEKFSITAGSQSLTIDYAAGEMDISEITNDNGTFYRLSIPGHISSAEPGKPELPVLCRLLTVPDGFEYRIEISAIKSRKIVPSQKKIKGLLYPAQESESKGNLQYGKSFAFDKSTYSVKALISSDTVAIKQIGTARGKRLAGLYIMPVRYNPGGNFMEVITSMQIRIIWQTGTLTASSRSARASSVSSVQSFDKSSLSYDPGSVIPGFSTKPVKMVIITDTIFRKQLQPFFKWKTEEGFNLKVMYRGVSLAGTTYAQFKDSLSRMYYSATPDNPAPEYLLIIGDISRIPKCDETANISDTYYGEFDGEGDYIPEMYIGRLPVSDTAEASIVVRKIIQYEKFQFADTNKFYTRALITAGNDAGYQTNMNGQLNYVLGNYINSASNIEEYHFYYPHSGDAGVEDSVKDLFKNGIGFVNYTGHGDATGWLDPVLKYKDVDSLNNKNMYPFMITNACRTSQFNNPTSLGYRMVLARDKGAVGYIGCSNDSYWDEDYYWAVGAGTVTLNPAYETKGLGAYDRLFHKNGESPDNWYITMGQINYAGNLAVSASTSSWKKYYWETYNLIGDPSMMPVIGKPAAFTMTIPDTLPNGMKMLSITGEPFSYIALSHNDSLWDASNVSPSGTVELSMPGISDDSCLMVVTGQNRIPIIKTIRIGNIKGEYISMSDNTINDSQGNNNGKADSGETFYFDLTVSNLGQTDANGLYAKIASSSTNLNINSDSVYIGTLKARSEKNITAKFQMTVTGAVPDLSTITIDLTLKDSKAEKHYKTDICIHAPELKIGNFIINDSITGNGNNSGDPGETFYLMFKVMNQGSSSATGHFTLASGNPGLEILDNDVSTPELTPGSVVEIPVKVRLDNTLTNGENISLSALLDCTPYSVAGDFIMRVGKLRESFESMNFNAFPWINVSKVPWTITTKDSYEGVASARSGAITHLGSTSLVIRTLFNSGDSIKFYYKVSSEPNYDKLIFKMNDTVMLAASGEIPWSKAVFAVKAGINRLEWNYSKDQSVSSGYDAAWIDLIDFAGSGFINYIRNDLQVARIVAPGRKNLYGQETVTVRLLNLGRDTVKGFNLAYLVNDTGDPVTQKFSNFLLPLGDSVTVSFATKTNLSRYGNYNIVTYSYDNADDYLPNDTLSIKIENNHVNDSSGVYPNPFTDHFTLFIQTSSSDKITISMFSSSGEKIYETERDIIAGMNSLAITDIDLPPGLYLLRMLGTSFERTLHVIRLRK